MIAAEEKGSRMARTETAGLAARAAARPAPRFRPSLWWLVAPTAIFFTLFCIIPVGSLFAISFDKAADGIITFQGKLTLANFERIFTRALYYDAIWRSIWIGVVTAFSSLLLGYPLAFLIARTLKPSRATLITIFVLASMQLDMVIRLYGLMVLLGDNGLVNASLIGLGVIATPPPLMYNQFGGVVGLVQITLPFMVLSLIGTIKSINPSLEEAARALGAGRRKLRRRDVPIDLHAPHIDYPSGNARGEMGHRGSPGDRGTSRGAVARRETALARPGFGNRFDRRRIAAERRVVLIFLRNIR